MLGNTPMMKQYEEIKNQYQDCLLFYRLGDFYEMFGPDAELGARVLGITLTARDGGLGKVPMCGVPFHSADAYIAKAIQAGYKVGICEQVEDPKSVKGIVKREVIRVISPGTMLEDSYLQGRNSNYLVSIKKGDNGYGMAVQIQSHTCTDAEVAFAAVSKTVFLIGPMSSNTFLCNLIHAVRPDLDFNPYAAVAHQRAVQSLISVCFWHTDPIS